MAKGKNSSKTSKKAHHGSAKSGSSHKSSSNHHHDFYGSSSQAEQEQLVDRYVNDERDYKSYAVEEYDPHQGAAQLQHQAQLREVLKRDY